MNGMILPMELAAVSMSGSRADMAITEAFTKLRDTPVVVKISR